jgi:hypothetical protein
MLNEQPGQAQVRKAQRQEKEESTRCQDLDAHCCLQGWPGSFLLGIVGRVNLFYRIQSEQALCRCTVQLLLLPAEMDARLAKLAKEEVMGKAGVRILLLLRRV